jgi:hypothetical protein
MGVQGDADDVGEAAGYFFTVAPFVHSRPSPLPPLTCGRQGAEVRLGKDDLYFLIGTVLALIALLGVDWKLVRGRIPMLSARNWLFLALILGSLIFSSVGWYKSRHLNPLKWTMTQADEQVVYGQHFRNEEVVLDGKKFDHCTFDNVTFVYHATAPVDFVECTFGSDHGALYLTTDNDAAKGFAKLMTMLKQLPGTNRFLVGEVDPAGNIKAYSEENKVVEPTAKHK